MSFSLALEGENRLPGLIFIKASLGFGHKESKREKLRLSKLYVLHDGYLPADCICYVEGEGDSLLYTYHCLLILNKERGEGDTLLYTYLWIIIVKHL